MARAHTYLKHADDAERLAKNATSEEERRVHLRLAALWRRFAMEKVSPASPGRKGAVDPQQIERVAREMAAADGLDPDGVVVAELAEAESGQVNWQSYREDAHRFSSEILGALNTAGFEAEPREDS